MNLRIALKNTVVFSLLLLLIGCGGESKDELIGTWEAIDVSADVNEYTNIKQDVLDQTLDYYRTVSFEFYENNSMNIVSSGNSNSGRWQFIDSESAVYINMENWPTSDFKLLGVLKNDTLISTNETGLGTIAVTYVKNPDSEE